MNTIWNPYLKSLIQYNIRYDPHGSSNYSQRKYVKRTRRLPSGRVTQDYSMLRTTVPKPLVEYLRSQFVSDGKLSPEQNVDLTNHQLILFCLINCVRDPTARNALFSAFNSGAMTPVINASNHTVHSQNSKQMLNSIHDSLDKLSKKVNSSTKARTYSYEHLLNVLYTSSLASAAVLFHFSVLKGNFSYFKNFNQLAEVLNCDSLHKIVDIAYSAGQNERKRVEEKRTTANHRHI